MGRIIAIDYGLKRTGLAVTDPLKIIATPLETIQTDKLIEWLNTYIDNEEVERIVVGQPTKLDQSDTHTTLPVKKLVENLKNKFPTLPISQIDERYTSRIAQQTMVLGGMKKKDRQKKGNIDKISATLILQSYLDQNKN